MSTQIYGLSSNIAEVDSTHNLFVKDAALLAEATAIDAKLPSLVSGAIPVTSPVKTTVSSPGTYTAINTALLTGVVSGWYDAGAFNSGSVCIYPADTGTVTAGQVLIEQTMDITALPLGTPNPYVECGSVNGAPSVSAYSIGANTPRYWEFPIKQRYIRVRITTGVTGTTSGIKAIAVLSSETYSTGKLNVYTSASAGFNVAADVVSVRGTPSVFATILTERALGISYAATSQFTDQNATTNTTTGNGTIVADSIGGCMGFTVQQVTFTASSGTPVIDVYLEESYNNGTTYNRIY